MEQTVFEHVPSYYGLITETCTAYKIQWDIFMNTSAMNDEHFISWSDLSRLTIDLLDVLVVLLGAIIWTVLRIQSSKYIFLPLAVSFGARKSVQSKFCESCWKFLFYLSAWTYSSSLLIWTKKYAYFDQPFILMTREWSPVMEIPLDIYILYMAELSFYLHSVYATLALDAWRKDSGVMLLHHAVTLVLIGISLIARYHEWGILVLLLFDLSDVILEFTKLVVYLKNGGKRDWLYEIMSNVGFLLFAGTWYLFRLYWFPLKVLYLSMVTMIDDPKRSFIPFLSFLLYVLLIMNIYWFTFIVAFVYRFLTGQLKEVKDIREDEEADTETECMNGDVVGTHSSHKKKL